MARAAVFMVLLALPGTGAAATSVAAERLDPAAAQIQAAIGQARADLAGSPGMMPTVAQSEVVQYFDYAHMAQIAVARNWRLATPEQRAALTSELSTLIARNYAIALSGYRGHNVEFKRSHTLSGGDVTVRSVMRQPGMEPISVEYDMQQQPAGWKVYDIKIGGMSLITPYRTIFAAAVRDSGIDGLIKSLADRNRQADLKRTELAEHPTVVYAIVQSVLRSAR